jgi:hypothetical protein
MGRGPGLAWPALDANYDGDSISSTASRTKTSKWTLQIVDDWHRPTRQIVRVQVASSAARSLLEQLIAAVAEAGATE